MVVLVDVVRFGGLVGVVSLEGFCGSIRSQLESQRRSRRVVSDFLGVAVCPGWDVEGRMKDEEGKNDIESEEDRTPREMRNK